MSNYSNNRQRQAMHARPICSCLAPARSSGKFCHIPLFSKQLQEAPRAPSTNPSEDRDLCKMTATPKSFCPSSFQSSCQLPSVTCSRRQGQKDSGCVISLCSSSVGRMCSELSAQPSEPASFKARQQGSQPQLGQIGHHAGVK